jgi:hypothetical protein
VFLQVSVDLMQTNWARQPIAGDGNVRAVIVMWRRATRKEGAGHRATCSGLRDIRPIP